MTVGAGPGEGHGAGVAPAAPPPARDSTVPGERPRWYTHRYNRSGYYRLAAATVPRVPRRVRGWLAAGAVRLVASRFAAERAAARRNLARIHPGRDGAWLDAASARVLTNFAVCFADLVSLNRAPAPRLWREVAGVHEQGPTRAALDRGRGCVCLTAHLGNSALAGRLLAPLGRPVHVVMAPEEDAGVAALLAGGGVDGSVRVVRRDSPLVSVALISALRRGEVVAFQMDRATGGRADAWVPFFSAPARLPLGPFLVAAAAGAPVVPAFCVLDEQGKYRLFVETAFDVARGEEHLGLRHAVGVLERYVRAYSEQWFNFFDVWSGDGG